MRTIKFRALRDDMSDCTFKYGQLTYGVDEITKKKFPRIHIPTYGGSNTAFSISCIPNTEGQFTGLCDKNRVEIYEGDILSWTSNNPFSLGEIRKVQVAYIQARFWCYGSIGIYLAELLSTEKCEVIGNIYQNKELLK